MRTSRLFINGEWLEGEAREVRSPFDNAVVSMAHYASEAQIEIALGSSVKAFSTYKRVSRYTRARLLNEIRVGIEARKSEFIDAIVAEAGKPVTLAEAELGRALNTFQIAAEEARRFVGEVFPMDLDPMGRDYDVAEVRWVPRGPVLGITPFNFPLNLVAHKVAPALAAGVSIIIKPAPQAPGASLLLAEVFAAAAEKVSDAKEKVDPATFQVALCSNELASKMGTDPRTTVLTFTGSGKVGWGLQRAAVGKKVTLELGGNAAVIVHSDADLTRAVARCVAGGFAYAGQSCISVQRIFVQQSVAAEFEGKLLEEVRKVKFGDPRERDVTVGPVIDEKAADRLENWIRLAEGDGALRMVGGTRKGNLMPPTLLKNVPRSALISCEEAFGPVVVLEAYDSFSDAIEGVNASQYGLQAGVFTYDDRVIRQALDELDVGGVLINDVPTYRADQQPYGGVKFSGLGREGLRYAMQEFSEMKTVIRWRG